MEQPLWMTMAWQHLDAIGTPEEEEQTMTGMMHLLWVAALKRSGSVLEHGATLQQLSFSINDQGEAVLTAQYGQTPEGEAQ